MGSRSSMAGKCDRQAAPGLSGSGLFSFLSKDKKVTAPRSLHRASPRPRSPTLWSREGQPVWEGALDGASAPDAAHADGKGRPDRTTWPDGVAALQEGDRAAGSHPHVTQTARPVRSGLAGADRYAAKGRACVQIAWSWMDAKGREEHLPRDKAWSREIHVVVDGGLPGWLSGVIRTTHSLSAPKVAVI